MLAAVVEPDTPVPEPAAAALFAAALPVLLALPVLPVLPAPLALLVLLVPLVPLVPPLAAPTALPARLTSVAEFTPEEDAGPPDPPPQALRTRMLAESTAVRAPRWNAGEMTVCFKMICPCAVNDEAASASKKIFPCGNSTPN